MNQETMEVLVVVSFPDFEARVSEKAWEKDVVDAVSSAVRADKTLDTIAVRPLEYEDCVWAFEGGMPIPDYDITVGQDGSWHSGITPFDRDPKQVAEICSRCLII